MNFHELYRKIEAIDKGIPLNEWNPFAKKPAPGQAAPGQTTGQPGGSPGQVQPGQATQSTAAQRAQQAAGAMGGGVGRAAAALGQDARAAREKAAGLEEGGNEITINGKEVDVQSLQIDGVDSSDYPDFSDAYVTSGRFVDGSRMSDDELDAFTDEHSDIINQLAYDSSIGEDLQEGDPDECGMMGGVSTSSIPKQQDSVSMNVSMNGAGAGGIRDLLNVLKDIQDGPAPDDSIDIDTDIDSTSSDMDSVSSGPDVLLKKNMDKMSRTIDDDFANSVPGDTGPKIGDLDMVTHGGDDLHKEKGAYPKANGGDNAMKLKDGATYKLPSSDLKIKLENLYHEILSRDLNEGSGPKEKQHSKYVDRNSAESKAKIQTAKDKMSAAEKAKPGKTLVKKINAK